MKKEDYEYYIKLALNNGADFVELFYEDSISKTYRMNDSKLDTIDTNNEKGVGIRISQAEDCYYTSTNNLTKENIEKLIKKITLNFEDNYLKKKVKLDDLVDKTFTVELPHDTYAITEKKKILNTIDETARKYSKDVTQVSAGIVEYDKNFIVANSDGKFVKGNNVLTRIVATIYVEKNERKEHEFFDIAGAKGYELLKDKNLKELTIKNTKTAIEKTNAKDFKGGELPVIIAPGFGAVIFHEACGHGLEATSVAPKLSVFSDDLNKNIATKKVTLIDDGTIANSWGSSMIDDEGNATQKNILIKDGKLTNYLVDYLNGQKMNCKSNGCGRRQNYHYAPTSRMSNTYLAPGKDKIEDMIKSIDLGIYCEKMSGGSVNTSTGDFNFAVETARLIEHGKLKHLVRGITLIGNSKDILKNVEMISDDLVLSAGYCGSKSGTIPVTIGQPTIKVSKILVGGKEE